MFKQGSIVNHGNMLGHGTKATMFKHGSDLSWHRSRGGWPCYLVFTSFLLTFYFAHKFLHQPMQPVMTLGGCSPEQPVCSTPLHKIVLRFWNEATNVVQLSNHPSIVKTLKCSALQCTAMHCSWNIHFELVMESLLKYWYIFILSQYWNIAS